MTRSLMRAKVRTPELDLFEERATELFEAGRAAVEEFLAEYQTQGSVARRAVAPRLP
jgi:hypothetical protein